MTQVAHPPHREITRVKVLMGLAILTAVVAAAAGLAMVIVAPESGSTAEAAFGLTAAISGLATAGLAIAAAIYAQVKNLWRYAPTWLRVVAWAVIVFAVISSLWGSLTRMS